MIACIASSVLQLASLIIAMSIDIAAGRIAAKHAPKSSHVCIRVLKLLRLVGCALTLWDSGVQRLYLLQVTAKGLG